MSISENSEGQHSGEDIAESALEALAIVENADGTELFVTTYDGQQCFSREASDTLPPDLPSRTLVHAWINGASLASLIKFQRGRAGRTPTISGGLSEVIGSITGDIRLRVFYKRHGVFVYQRACSGQMPLEQDAFGRLRWVRWLAKQQTYGSRALDTPLPDRVSEWLEGRILTPRMRTNVQTQTEGDPHLECRVNAPPRTRVSPCLDGPCNVLARMFGACLRALRMPSRTAGTGIRF